MEIVNVIAVSTKKDQGWIKCAPIEGSGVWQDSGMHFDKSKIIFTPGLYAVDYVNNASLGGTSLDVIKADKIISFDEIASEYLGGNE